MIGIPSHSLPADLQRVLDEHHGKLGRLPDHAARVREAPAAWERAARDLHPIREILLGMCSGEDRCMYCEDSAASEIDHFRPKHLYPELTFAWHNYLYACSTCNRFKGARFGVLSSASRQFVEPKRRREGEVALPEATRTAMLIDPRREDPMRFLALDLVFPFHFHPRGRRGCVARARASYTIEVLGLNAREKLIRRREAAYWDFLDKLSAYMGEADPEKRARCKDRILKSSHFTVWREMQRQRDHIADLHRLFDGAPEALSW